MKCSVPDCTNNKKRVNKAQGITYHTFPRNPVMRTLWTKALGLGDKQPKTHHVVCSQHFKKDNLYMIKAGYLRLKSDAVPKINPCQNVESSSFKLRSPYQTSIEPTVKSIIKESCTDKLICRICLCKDRKTYNLETFNLFKYYELLTASQISKEDELPKQVCWECKARLYSFARLRGVARQSLTLLRTFYNTVKSDPEASIKSADIDKDFNNLTSTLTKNVFECDHADYHFIHEQFAPQVDDIKNENDISDKNDGLSELDLNIAVDNIETVFHDANDNRNVHDTKFDDENDYQNVYDTKFDVENDHLNVYDTKFDVEYDNQNIDDTKFLEEIDHLNVDDENDDKSVHDIEFDDESDDQDVDDLENDTMEIDSSDISDLDLVLTDSDEFSTSDDDSLIIMKNKKVNLINKMKLQTKTRKKIIVRREKPDWEEFFDIKEMSIEERMLSVQNRRETSNYKNSEYKCEFCVKGFWFEDTYQRHLAKHSEESGKYQCDYCKFRFKTKNAMMHHRRALHSKQYSCKQCDFVSMSPDTAILHERYHQGKRYKCPHCEMEFIKLTTYMGHLRRNHPSDFVCQLCGCSCVSAKGLAMHLKFKHNEDQQEIPEDGPMCVSCNIQFVNEEALNTHQKSTKHNNNTVSMRRSMRAPILIDDKTIIMEQGTRAVKRRRTRKTPLNCEQCDVQLADFKKYSHHFRTYHPEKNRTLYPNHMKSMCDICGKILPCLANLYEHNLTHKGDKQFSCSQCGKSFSNTMRLKIHEKIHLKRTKFSCDVCSKKFFSKGNLTRHMVIHMGIKFDCEICGKSFNHSDHKKAHIEYVHLKKPRPKRNRVARNKRKIQKSIQTENSISPEELSNIDDNSTPFVEDTITSD